MANVSLFLLSIEVQAIINALKLEPKRCFLVFLFINVLPTVKISLRDNIKCIKIELYKIIYSRKESQSLTLVTQWI